MKTVNVKNKIYLIFGGIWGFISGIWLMGNALLIALADGGHMQVPQIQKLIFFPGYVTKIIGEQYLFKILTYI